MDCNLEVLMPQCQVLSCVVHIFCVVCCVVCFTMVLKERCLISVCTASPIYGWNDSKPHLIDKYYETYSMNLGKIGEHLIPPTPPKKTLQRLTLIFSLLSQMKNIYLLYICTFGYEDETSADSSRNVVCLSHSKAETFWGFNFWNSTQFNIQILGTSICSVC